ncbi:MAG: hypothetical protein R2706_11940 [Acidimicrobiales bacterium]
MDELANHCGVHAVGDGVLDELHAFVRLWSVVVERIGCRPFRSVAGGFGDLRLDPAGAQAGDANTRMGDGELVIEAFGDSDNRPLRRHVGALWLRHVASHGRRVDDVAVAVFEKVR